jgi:hypothetical protein
MSWCVVWSALDSPRLAPRDREQSNRPPQAGAACQGSAAK